jgi:hypothetical protein
LLEFRLGFIPFSPRPRSSTSSKMTAKTVVQYPKISQLNPDDVRRYVKNQMESLELLLKSIEPVDEIKTIPEEKKIVVEEKYCLSKPIIEEKIVAPFPNVDDQKLIQDFCDLARIEIQEIKRELNENKLATRLVQSSLVKKRKCNSDDEVDESSKKIKQSNSKILLGCDLDYLHRYSGYKPIALDFKKAVENGEKLKTIEIELFLDYGGFDNFKLVPYCGNSMPLYGIKMAVCGTCCQFCSSGKGLLRHYRNRHFNLNEQRKLEQELSRSERRIILKLIVLE